MTTIQADQTWQEVTEIQPDDYVIAGPNQGINIQLGQLAGRDNYLKKIIQDLKTELKNEIETNATLIRKTVPAGVVLFLAGPVEPEGWMICNGRKLKKSEFPELFKAIGTTWGGGDDYFCLPESFEDYLRCASSQLPVGTKQGDAMRNLTGSFAISNSWLNDYCSGIFYCDNSHLPEATDIYYTSSAWDNVTRENTGALVEGQHLDASRQVPTANEFRPKSSVMWVIIKY